MSDYGVTIQDIKRIGPMIGSGQAVQMEVRNENWEWNPVEALVSFEPIEDGAEAEVVSEGGPQSAFEKRVYIKILKQLDSEAVVKKYDIVSYDIS